MNGKELLELLAPYLPYGLEVSYILKDESEFIPDKIVEEYSFGGICIAHQFDLDWNNEFKSYLPILRPLSDLTKPCLEEGKVPIVELGEMLGYKGLSAYEIDGVIEYGWTQHNMYDSQGYAFGWSKELMTFGVWYDEIDGNPIETICNVGVINQLYKWHFDIYGLIEKGYALDINDIKD